MHKSNKLAFANIWQFFIDISVILISYLIAYLLSYSITTLSNIHNYFWILIIFIPVWTLSMSSLGMYNKTTFTYYDRIIRSVFFSSIISGITLAATFFFIKDTMFSRILFVVFMILNAIFIALERYVYVFILNKFNKLGSKRVIIVGASELALRYIYYLKKTTININLLGYVHVQGDRPIKAKKNFGNIEDLENILKQNVIDEVIFALPHNYVGAVDKYVLLCEQMGLVVRVLLDLYDVKISKIHLASIGPIPMVTFHSVSLNKFQLSLKRLIDIIGSIVGLIITGLISIFIIVAIKIDSKGPVFFSQNRAGLNGRIFKLYKFRSMHIDAEARKAELMQYNQVDDGLMFKMDNDPRITRVGNFLRKTSLDELPQFTSPYS